ncbi:hypothetical protein TWF481_005721 [Arthrobotrys musiformis]|uniref:Uncharacterized protein n=1 Tax=Arthrobotrys musiformis TaxID=47236 RepID=A0AAV9WEL0_9PEZI
MEAVIRPQHTLLMNFPGPYQKHDGKKSGEKKSRLRPSWLRTSKSNIKLSRSHRSSALRRRFHRIYHQICRVDTRQYISHHKRNT